MHVNNYLTYDKNETILTVLKNLGNKALSCVGKANHFYRMLLH